jgi:hypothetical protein
LDDPERTRKTAKRTATATAFAEEWIMPPHPTLGLERRTCSLLALLERMSCDDDEWEYTCPGSSNAQLERWQLLA